jgi:hypothetical protein
MQTFEMCLCMFHTHISNSYIMSQSIFCERRYIEFVVFISQTARFTIEHAQLLCLDCGTFGRIFFLTLNKVYLQVYVGQSGRTISVRFKEHVRYIRSNNSTSAYATHILENRHEYGTKENTLQLLKACRKRTHMDCWETLFIQTLH